MKFHWSPGIGLKRNRTERGLESFWGFHTRKSRDADQNQHTLKNHMVLRVRIHSLNVDPGLKCGTTSQQ